MNKLEKTAYVKFQNKIALFERKKENAYNDLMRDEQFLELHKKENSLIIDLSQCESKEKHAQLAQIQKEKSSFIEKSQHFQILKNEHLCTLCADKGYFNGKQCKCFKKFLSEFALQQSGLNINLEDYATSDFSIFENPENMKKLYSTIDKWLADPQKSQIKNWAFMGHTGTGKTHLMFYMTKKLIDNGLSIYFTTAYQLVKDLIEEYTLDFEEDKEEKPNYLEKYLDCDVLFIDDLGTEPQYKNISKQFLYTIFNQRMLDNVPTVFSSNMDLGEFETFYGERIFSRLINKRTTKSIWFGGEDLRLKK